MGVPKPTAPAYFWYQKLRVLAEEAGQFSPQFLYWSGLLGGSDYQELIKTDEFCAMGEPYEIEWTLENLISYGTVAVLDSWARKQMYKRYCAGSE